MTHKEEGEDSIDRCWAVLSERYRLLVSEL